MYLEFYGAGDVSSSFQTRVNNGSWSSNTSIGIKDDGYYKEIFDNLKTDGRVVEYKIVYSSGMTSTIRITTKVYNSNLESLKKFIKSYSSKYEDVTHFAYTFLDDHDDHEALGSALTSLYYDSNETGFENVYLIVKSTEMIGRNRHVTPDNTAKKYTGIAANNDKGLKSTIFLRVN